MKQFIKLYYFFIWGNHPALALAEVLATLNRWHIRSRVVGVSVEAGIIEVRQYLPEVFIEQLGGTIKLGRIIDKVALKELTADYLANILLQNQTGKIIFGLSQYRLHNLSKLFPQSEFERLGKSIKHSLRGNHKVRWVVSRQLNLSSVVVKKNRLIDEGEELVLLLSKKNIWLGRTIAVQPFEEYSRRDYGRISVDPRSGMLPPKLAQMMLNLSGANPKDIILDPFCGSGTILQEALMMGWHHVVGSDSTKKAISDTKQNTTWLKKRYGLRRSIIRLFQSDARNLSEHLQGSYITAIVTEPYLGPALKRIIDEELAEKIRNKLEALYLLAFIDFKKYLKERGRVVMVWPVFILSRARGGAVFINLFSELQKEGFCLLRPFNTELSRYKMGGVTPRGTLIYGRPKQKVWREIVVFEHKEE